MEKVRKYKVCVIGNGFDLYHDLPTRFSDYLSWSSLKESNILISYFNKLGISKDTSWLDFEEELKIFLSNIERMKTKVELYPRNNVLRVNSEVFITNSNQRFFYNFILGYGFKFLGRDNHNGSIVINNQYEQRWSDLIEQEVRKDFMNFVDDFNNYLKNEVQPKIEKISNSFKDTNAEIRKQLNQASEVIVFNYTNTVEVFKVKQEKVKYVHGKLGSKIIIGISDLKDYSSKFTSFFNKSTQLLSNNTDIPTLFSNKLDENSIIEYTFIGHSFGESDFYFFFDILNVLKKEHRYTNTKFTFYIHEEKSIFDYAHNLVKFFGEMNLLKLKLNNNIEFKNYSDDLARKQFYAALL